jgi:RAD51-like protein 1
MATWQHYFHYFRIIIIYKIFEYWLLYRKATSIYFHKADCSSFSVQVLKLFHGAVIVHFITLLSSFTFHLMSSSSSRSLRQSQLPTNIVSTLSTANIKTCGDFLNTGKLRMAQLLPNMNINEIESLFLCVSRVVAPNPQSAQDLHNRLLNVNNSVLTGLPNLDQVLGQGIPSDTVTEFVGRAGVGKTQSCFTLAVQACLPTILDMVETTSGTVCYLDTERKFSAVRVLEIAEARLQKKYPNATSEQIKETSRVLVSKIHVFTLTSCKELLECVRTLQSFIISNHVRLIVVDSVAAVARQDFTESLLVQRQAWLNMLVSELKYLAEVFHLPVVVTNQVTTKSGDLSRVPKLKHQNKTNTISSATLNDSEDYGYLAHSSTSVLHAALGNTWAHGVNTRLFFDVDCVPGTNHGGERCIHLTKSPIAPYTRVPFQLDEYGISPITYESNKQRQ